MDAGAAVSLVGSFVVLGLVLLGTAAAGGAGTLPRNGAVGLRTRATQASDRAWAAGHRAASGPARATGLLCLAFAVLIALLAVGVRGQASVAVVLTAAGVGYVALTAGLVVAVRRADSAARRAPPDAP